MQINRHVYVECGHYLVHLLVETKLSAGHYLQAIKTLRTRNKIFRKFYGTFHLMMDFKTDCTLLRIPIVNGSTIFW
jgi:hypothetical protein